MKFRGILAVFLLIGLPLFIWAVATQRIELRKKASELPIASVRINPEQIAVPIGATQINLSALAYDANNNPLSQNIIYQWGMSSTGSVGTFTQQGSLASFYPSKTTAGTGDLWVRATGPGGQTAMRSIPISVGITPLPTTIPVGCYKELVQCVRAPCDPIIVCPTNTLSPSPTSSPSNYCSGPNGSPCTSTSACPTCAPGQPCPRIACRGVAGVCQNNFCAPLPPNCRFVTACRETYPPQCTTRLVCTTPTPTPQACVRNKPTVTITPNNQQGNPGQQLTYYASITNKDVGCNSQFTYQIQVPTGFITGVVTPSIIPAGQTTNISFFVKSPLTNTNPTTIAVPVSFTATNAASGQSATANAAYTLVKPSPQIIEIRVTLAGVQGNQADGAKLTSIKFALRNGTVMGITTPITLQYRPTLTTRSGAIGVYSAQVKITNPMPRGTQYRISVKAEKHGSVRFCRSTEQRSPCNDEEYIIMAPNETGGQILDLTGIPLPAGDLNQDGSINLTDVALITNIFKKPDSQKTADDIKLADVNYDKYVDNFDLNLVLQSLSVRHDE